MISTPSIANYFFKNNEKFSSGNADDETTDEYSRKYYSLNSFWIIYYIFGVVAFFVSLVINYRNNQPITVCISCALVASQLSFVYLFYICLNYLFSTTKTWSVQIPRNINYTTLTKKGHIDNEILDTIFSKGTKIVSQCIDMPTSSMQTSDMQFPLKVPDMKIPAMEVPAMKIPDMKVPAMKIPAMEVPAMKIPDMKVPMKFPADRLN
jgi:hypothetical protein